MNNQELESQIKNCKTLSELNELSKKIKKDFDNLNHHITNKREELIQKENRPSINRKKIFRDLNNLSRN